MITIVYNNRKPSIYLDGVLVKTGVTSARNNVYSPTLIGENARLNFFARTSQCNFVTPANGRKVYPNVPRSNFRTGKTPASSAQVGLKNPQGT